VYAFIDWYSVTFVVMVVCGALPQFVIFFAMTGPKPALRRPFLMNAPFLYFLDVLWIIVSVLALLGYGSTLHAFIEGVNGGGGLVIGVVCGAVWKRFVTGE
jgi:hypothetical protein